MYSAHDTPKGWVSPFGHPRINDRSHLPAAFRSVPRPSSPPGAKASTECPSFTPTPPPARRTQPHPKRHRRSHATNRTLASPSTQITRPRPSTQLTPSRTPEGFTHQIQIHHAKQHGQPRKASQPNRQVFRIQTAHRRSSHNATQHTGTKPNSLETIGFEPMTPCLQSRCSPAELRPHRNEHSAKTNDQSQAVTIADRHGPGRT